MFGIWFRWVGIGIVTVAAFFSLASIFLTLFWFRETRTDEANAGR